MKYEITMGSLFDGSGGFPLAGMLSGIRPVWASEVEPYPIAVSHLHFPQMRHLGSVTGIDGATIQPVDVITFGSPCQDLSVAGKRTGIHDGKRSNLFFEAVRIIKEMRGATNEKYPRYAVWENVPGAFSSNQGHDFHAVLQALVKAAGGDPGNVPFPTGGKWLSAGEIVGDSYSVAWRILDAQYRGVPQRRKRIYLVADFGGERAGQILFEREGVRGDSAPGAEARQGAATDAPGSAGGSSVAAGDCLIAFHAQQDPISSEAVTPCLGGQGQATVAVVYPQIARTLEALNTAPSVVYPNTSGTLRASADAMRVPQAGSEDLLVCHQTVCGTLDATSMRHTGGMKNEANLLVCHSVDCRNMCMNQEKSGTLQSKANGGQSLNYVNPVVYACGNGQLNAACAPLSQQAKALDCMHDQQIVLHEALKPTRRFIVRRLLPVECARLQGFPDDWGKLPYASSVDYDFWRNVRRTKAEIDGSHVKGWKDEQMLKWYNGLYSESAEYKMWGNGIALPCATAVLVGIADAERNNHCEGNGDAEDGKAD